MNIFLVVLAKTGDGNRLVEDGEIGNENKILQFKFEKNFFKIWKFDGFVEVLQKRSKI